VLPIIIWRARHDRRHPRSKGHGKEFIYFFLQEKWASFLRLYIRPGNHGGCIGGGLHINPWELLLVSLQWKETHWKQKQPPACRIHVQLFESTCKRKSILHSFFIQQHSKRNHQSKLLTEACIFAATTSQRCMCLAYHELCIYNKTNNKGTNEADYK